MKTLAKAAAVLAALGVFTYGLCAQEKATGPYATEADYLADVSAARVYISGVDLVGLATSVELIIDDQVDGACWTNSTAVAARIRAELEKFGIAVYQEELAFNTAAAPVLRIMGLGYRLPNDVCFASVEMTVEYWSTSDLGSLAYTSTIYSMQSWSRLWASQTIFTSVKNIDQQLIAQVQEWVDTYIADVSKARRIPAVHAAYQLWGETDPMTQKKFDAIIAGIAETKN